MTESADTETGVAQDDGLRGQTYEDARVFWTKESMETYQGKVTVYENGWVEVHGSAELFPDLVVHEVSL